MTETKKDCPICHSVVSYYGEGGYGKCSNNQCTFELKIEGCDTEPCDALGSKEKKNVYPAND